MENALKSDAGSFSSSRLPPCFAENFFTGTLRAECACDNYNSSACARVSDGVLQVVRRSVGAPTAHACAGDGSHHSEDISPGRSGPPGEFSGAHFGSGSRGGLRRAPAEKPLRLDARGSLARAALVRREGNARVGAHPAGRSGNRAHRRLEPAVELLRLLDRKARWLAAAIRPLRRLRNALWRETGFLRRPSA